MRVALKVINRKINTGSRCIDLNLAIINPPVHFVSCSRNFEAASSIIYFDFVFLGTIDFTQTSSDQAFPLPDLCDSSLVFRPRSFSDCNTRKRSIVAISCFGRRSLTVASGEISDECGTH